MRFASNLWISIAFVAVWLILAVLAVTTSDAAGRLLYGAVCVVLAAVCATDLIWRPRLTVDRAGVRVRAPSGTVRLGWPQIDRVAVEERQRLGVTVRSLEIDAGEQLVVLGQRALGRDPRQVADLVNALRPTD